MAFPGSHLLLSFLRSRRNDNTLFNASVRTKIPQFSIHTSTTSSSSPIPNIFCSRNDLSITSVPKFYVPTTDQYKFRVPVAENDGKAGQSKKFGATDGTIIEPEFYAPQDPETDTKGQSEVSVPVDEGTVEPPAPACSKFNENDIFSHSMRPNRVAGFYGRALPEHLIDFSSSTGKRLFGESLNNGHMENYFKLAGQYFAQSDVAFCGLAVLCMVLNSLSIDPARIWKSPWRWYSEEMMGCCTPLDQVRKKGIDFDKFKCLATCKGATVKAIRYNESTLESFREDIKRVTSSTGEFMVVCYNRKHVGQTGTGHFAPVGGYHEASDRVLLLDVARFKYPSHWVELPLIYGAMKDIDPATEKSRGYFLLSGITQQTPNAKLNERPAQG